jgi:ABC-type branched-subunit amino acid transport system substrate-binding protein
VTSITRLVGRRRGIAAVVCCVAVTAATACGGDNSTSSSGGSGAKAASGKVKLPDKFVIGATLPLTGAAASYGATMRNGMETAIKEINAGGGIEGVKVEGNYQDFGAGDVAKGVSAAKQLVANKAVAIQTCYIAVPLAQEPVVTQAKTPLFVPCEGEDQLLGKDWIYHIVPTFDSEMATLEKYISDQGHKKLTILTGDTTSKEVSNYLVENWKKLTGQPANLVLLDATTTDPTPEVNKALSTKPDAMIVAVVGTLGQTVVEKLAANNVTFPLFGGIASSAYIKQITAGKLDWSFTAGQFKNSPEFLKAFKANGGKGDPGFWDSSFYTATMVTKDGLEAAIKAGQEPNGANLKAQLDKMTSFGGCCGTFSFGPEHSAAGAFSITQIKDGAAPKVVASVPAVATK